MPYSDRSLRPWIASRLRDLGVMTDSVVDVGAGAGTARGFYGRLFPGARWTAIEVWEPYVTEFRLEDRYDRVIAADVRHIEFPAAGLVLFGDVLEHMPADDAVRVWDRARAVSSWLVIGVPVLDYPQGEVCGNPYEAHQHQWTTESVLASFAGITDHAGPLPGSTVGAFIAQGLR